MTDTPAGTRDEDADDTEAEAEADEADEGGPPARPDGDEAEAEADEDGDGDDGEGDGEAGDDGLDPQLTRDTPPATGPAPPLPPYGEAEEEEEDDDGDEGLGAIEPPYGEREVRSSPEERGCGGTVGETPAGPATPGVAVALRLPLPFLPPLTVDWPPVSPRAARAWEIRIASMVMSWRISERLQARSASSHMVVRWTGSVPVTSANATIAPFGASSLPLRYRSQDVLL